MKFSENAWAVVDQSKRPQREALDSLCRRFSSNIQAIIDNSSQHKDYYLHIFTPIKFIHGAGEIHCMYSVDKKKNKFLIENIEFF